MPLDLSDPKDVKKLKETVESQGVELTGTLVNLMKSQTGREFVWKRLEMSRVFLSSFSPDAMEMAFNEGRRTHGVTLYAELMKHCPDEYVLMAREADARDTAVERVLSEDGNRRDQEPDQLDFYRDL